MHELERIRILNGGRNYLKLTSGDEIFTLRAFS
jgi:hypothetical protein